MGRRIKTFLRRLRGMNFQKMWLLINTIHQEAHVPRLWVLADMMWCAVVYGIGYLDYRVFGFVYIHGKKRRTFMTMNHNLTLVRHVNDKQYDPIFTDKVEFNKTFAAYIGRSWLDLRESDFEAFEAFVQGKKHIFAKVLDGFGGVGVTRVTLSEHDHLRDLYDALLENRQFLVEDRLIQHHEMDKLCATSINTIRITSVLSKGEAHLMYALVRMGDGTKYVDNISSGGMYCPVNEDGVLTAPAFCDKTGQCYDIHPSTQTRLVGFRIPYFKQAQELVRQAAKVVPQIRYVGWDVAICEDGPKIIEGNTIPGYDMCQNYYHLPEGQEGILPKFQAVFGKDLSDFSE